MLSSQRLWPRLFKSVVARGLLPQGNKSVLVVVIVLLITRRAVSTPANSSPQHSHLLGVGHRARIRAQQDRKQGRCERAHSL